MSLSEELKLDQPIETVEHESVLNIVYTASLISKVSFRYFRANNITDAQFNALMQLKYAAHQELSQIELSRRLVVNRANITGLIDRLEKIGLVKRTYPPQDRRVIIVKITEKGFSLLEKLEPVYFEHVNRLMNHIGKQQMKQLMQYLETIRHNLKTIRF